MAAIANGLAAFNRGTIIPVTSSFFMFYLVNIFYTIFSTKRLT
jgi:dihydroxyacetone synthase